MELKNNINGDNIKEIIYREGNAELVQKEPLRIAIVGTLKAPLQFLQDKLEGSDVDQMGVKTSLVITEDEKIYNPKRSHILVNAHEGSLVLVLNEKDATGDTVTGRLKLFQDLLQFRINESHMYSIKELISLVKKYKVYFADPMAHTEFLLSLQRFSTRVSTEIKRERENNGSRFDMVSKVVNENKEAPKFKLNIPIYQGYGPRTFEVEACVDVTDVNVSFYLESIELYELIKSEKEKHLNDQTSLIREIFPCSIVEVA